MEYIKTDIKYGYCLTHGWTPFYKNGKCKECVKYKRLETFYRNRLVKKGY